MEAVIIGVSDRSLLALKGEEVKELIKEYAHFLNNHNLTPIITPNDGIYTDIADEYQKISDKKAIAYFPDKDTTYGYDHLKESMKKYDSKPIHGDWYKLNAELTLQADVTLCLGFSPGTLIELSYMKYHQKFLNKKSFLFIDARCSKEKLPESFHEQINNTYYFNSINELEILFERFFKG